MWISPSHQDTDFQQPLSLDDKITIFEARTFGWKLDIADQMINGIIRLDVGVLVQTVVGVADISLVGVIVIEAVAVEMRFVVEVGVWVPKLEHALENNKISGIITDNWFIIAPSPLHSCFVKIISE